MILPTHLEVKEARQEVGLSQVQAARLVHVTENTWQRYETPVESDQYVQISGSNWELFLIKTNRMRHGDSKYRVRDQLKKHLLGRSRQRPVKSRNPM